jgi:hypothetical protein
LETLIKTDGSRTGDQIETLETLMLTHFPESRIVRDSNGASEDILKTMDGSQERHGEDTGTYSKGKKVKWAIHKFKPYKSFGPYGILPALMQG